MIELVRGRARGKAKRKRKERRTLAVDDDGLAELLGLGQAGQDVSAEKLVVSTSETHIEFDSPSREAKI